MPYINNKYKGVAYLHMRLKAAGVENYTTTENFRVQWLKKLEDRGQILLPRHPVNPRIRLVTEEQIDEIIKAFSPGGNGVWKYK